MIGVNDQMGFRPVERLGEFQKKLGKYNRMFEMMSKVMANAHEMKKALIANLPR